MDEHFPTVGTGESILWICLEGLRAREVFGRRFFFFFNFHLKKLHDYLVDPKVCFFL